MLFKDEIILWEFQSTDVYIQCSQLFEDQIMNVCKTMIISWINANFTHANPEKSQVIISGNFHDTVSIEAFKWGYTKASKMC